MKFPRYLTLRGMLFASAMVLLQALLVSALANPDRYYGQISTAPDAVHLAGEEVFNIPAPAGGFSALERAIIVERNINDALKATTDRSPAAVQVVYINNIPVVRLGGFHIVTADTNCAKLANCTTDVLAAQWAESMRKVLTDTARVDTYVASLGGDFIQPTNVVPYRRARLEAARLNHAAPQFRGSVPVGLISSDSATVTGMTALSARDPVTAGEAFRKAIVMSPDNARAHYGLGLCLMQQGKVDQSIDEFQMARWLDPDYALNHIALGQAFETKGLKIAAIKQYQEAALLQPDNPEPYLLIADIREDRNDVGQSVAELTSALKQIPDSEYIYLQRKDQLTWRLRRPF